MCAHISFRKLNSLDVFKNAESKKTLFSISAQRSSEQRVAKSKEVEFNKVKSFKLCFSKDLLHNICCRCVSQPETFKWYSTDGFLLYCY